MRIVIPFILLFFFDKLQAQDTLYFGSEGLKSSWKIDPTGYLLEDKIIKDTGIFSFVENVTNSLPKLSRKCIKDTCILPNHMLLSRCSFSNLKTYYTKLYFSTANVFNFKSDFTFTVEHSKLKGDIGVSGMYMDTSRPFALNHDTLQAAHFIYCNGWFNIGQSVIAERISFDHCRLSDLQVDQNDFSIQDTAQISVKNSVINRFGASGNNAKSVKFLFANDSLFRDFSVFRVDHENVKKDSGGVFVFVFENCFLNCDLNISESSKQITVRFLNCSFGKDFNLTQLYIDSLEFDNCTKFQETIDLNRIASEHLFISFINTDLKNFRFNYLGRFNLYFPNGRTSVKYLKLDSGYALDLTNGWIGKPNTLMYPDDFLKALDWLNLT